MIIIINLPIAKSRQAKLVFSVPVSIFLACVTLNYWWQLNQCVLRHNSLYWPSNQRDRKRISKFSTKYKFFFSISGFWRICESSFATPTYQKTSKEVQFVVKSPQRSEKSNKDTKNCQIWMNNKINFCEYPAHPDIVIDHHH